MAYTTLESVKEYLGIEEEEDTDDSLLESLILTSEDFIDKYTSNSFESVEKTKHYFHYSLVKNTLILDDFIQSVTTLTNGDGNIIPSNQYILLPKNGSAYTEILLKSSYSWEFDDIDESFITVNGMWGLYSTAPSEISHATIRLTSYLYRQKDNHQDIDRTIVTGNSTILPQSLPADLRMILGKYRKIF